MSGRLTLLWMLLEMRVAPQQRIHAMVWKTKALQIWHEHGREMSFHNRIYDRINDVQPNVPERRETPVFT